MFYFKYALKSLIQRRRQYVSLFVVCTISVCIIISLLSICDGMLKALNTKAVQYYGGELQFYCGDTYVFTDADEKIKLLQQYFDENNIEVSFYKRFDGDASNCQLYFEGENSFARILKGIDFSEEKELLKTFTFSEEKLNNSYQNKILISDPIAQKLRVHAGDSITLLLKTLDGYTNTMDLYVSGIYKDSSLFGMYTVYLDIDCLRKISCYDKYSIPYINRIGINVKNKSLSNKDIKRLQLYLSENCNMAPLPNSKEEFFYFAVAHKETPVYALITLDANRPEVVMMSNALRLIVYLIIIPLVLIVAIGISCSYRVVILKRIVETSTFRALGLKARGVEKLFFTEVLMILLVGFIVGTVLSFAVTAIIGHFNFSFIPAFDLFLIGGRIKADYSFWKIIFVLFIIAFSTLTGVFVTLRNIIRLSPAKAFATTV